LNFDPYGRKSHQPGLSFKDQNNNPNPYTPVAAKDFETSTPFQPASNRTNLVVRDLRLDSVVNRALTDHKGRVDMDVMTNFREIQPIAGPNRVNVKIVQIDPN
jgi:hypothetical protein